MRLLPAALTAVLLLASCQDQNFLNYSREKARNPLLECKCPGGFTVNPGADGCGRELKADPTSTGTPELIEIGDTDGSYLSQRLYFANGDASTQWPFALEPRSGAIDATLHPLPEAVTPMAPFWRNRVLAPDRISIRSTPYIWHTKTVCVDLPKEKLYTIFIGGDNNWNLKVDGVDYAKCTQEYCFVDGRFIAQTFKSGKHLVEMKYFDQGGFGALWYEIYDQPLDSVRAATQAADLKILFSTKTLVGQRWDYSGEICPPGYAYDVCANDHKCTKLEKAACL